jgi:hypothetical protein
MFAETSPELGQGDRAPVVTMISVTPSYLATMGLSLIGVLRGRGSDRQAHSSRGGGRLGHAIRLDHYRWRFSSRAPAECVGGRSRSGRVPAVSGRARGVIHGSDPELGKPDGRHPHRARRSTAASVDAHRLACRDSRRFRAHRRPDGGRRRRKADGAPVGSNECRRRTDNEHCVGRLSDCRCCRVLHTNTMGDVD